ncbi:MAG TPA: MarR family transcriptional regulator [Gammaproteobacteria bacterium]|nr:MarR family transcriptional regulator [Gammaproteobacteria bacterium]
MAKNPEALKGWAGLGKPERIGFLLKSLQHTLRQTIDEALRKQGVELSFAHLAALFNLHYDPGISGAQLARRAMVSAQTMHSALRALEQDGYIERRPHPASRRADSWSLTRAGLAELKRARAVGSAVFGRMLTALTTPEIAAFEDSLGRCIAALDDGAERDDAVPDQRARVAAVQRRQKAGASSTRNV